MKTAILCTVVLVCFAAISVQGLLLPPKLKFGDTIGFVSPGTHFVTSITDFSSLSIFYSIIDSLNDQKTLIEALYR